jgi:hypothetical protein
LPKELLKKKARKKMVALKQKKATKIYHALLVLKRYKVEPN